MERKHNFETERRIYADKLKEFGCENKTVVSFKAYYRKITFKFDDGSEIKFKID